MEEKRRQMCEKIKVDYGFDSPRVLEILQKVPRHKFLPKKYWKIAYEDAPVSIGYGQTMSQPYTVAVMTHLATEFLEQSSKDLSAISNFEFLKKFQARNLRLQEIKKMEKVLEIGTGSGYQAAVLSYFFDEVYTVEIIPQLAGKAKKTLFDLGFTNVDLRIGNGSLGWKVKSPFDAIMITAGVEKVPGELFNQVKTGGVMVAPVGEREEKVMTRITKLKSLKVSELNNPTTLVLRGAWEEFGKFSFVPFVKLPSSENTS